MLRRQLASASHLLRSDRDGPLISRRWSPAPGLSFAGLGGGEFRFGDVWASAAGDDRLGGGDSSRRLRGGGPSAGMSLPRSLGCWRASGTLDRSEGGCRCCCCPLTPRCRFWSRSSCLDRSPLSDTDASAEPAGCTSQDDTTNVRQMANPAESPIPCCFRPNLFIALSPWAHDNVASSHRTIQALYLLQ